MNEHKDIVEGPILKSTIKYILPLMATGILQLLYNAADSIVVGHWDGAGALAAVSSVSSLISLLVNVFMGLSVGTAVTVAHDYGAGDKLGVERTVHTSILVSLIGGIIVALIGLFFSRTFLVWMDSPADVIDMSETYLIIFFLGTPASMLYNFGAAILRSVGETKKPLIYLTVSGLINVVLNMILVIVFHMGVAGVAIATVVSQAVTAMLVIRHLMTRDDCTRLDLKKLMINSEKLKKILRVGLPAGFQGTVFSLSNVVIQSSVNSFGSLAMAGNGAASSLEGFTYIAMNSVYHASLTFTGQSVGARRYDRINKICFTCLGLVTVIGLVFGAATYLGSDFLLQLYLPNDPLAIPYGQTRLLYIALAYFLCGTMEVMVGAQRGMGMSLLPMINALIGSCLLRIVWIETVFEHFRTLPSIYISYPVSWLVTTLAHMLFYFLRLRKLKRTLLPEPR